MKKTIAILFFLPLFFLSCNGQESKNSKTAYVQKLEYGLNGPVKEVILYTCSAENGIIPADTTNYVGKRTSTFDREGNMLEMHRVWRPNRAENSRIRKSDLTMTFFGKGRDISLEISYVLEDGQVEKYAGKYVWSDDYNYTVVNLDNDNTAYANHTTLGKDLRVIKTAFKERDTIQSGEELTYHYKNNTVQEIINTITEYGNNVEKKLTYQVRSPQKYDAYGNPTLTYEYSDLEKQHLTEVYFTVYQYYGDEKSEKQAPKTSN